MRIKLDENIPISVGAVLTQLGHDVDTVADEGLTGEEDDRVWAESLQANRFFITQDLDFSDLRKFAPGSHPGLLLIRLDHPSRTTLTQRIEQIAKNEDIDTWSGCFVVVTRHKIRIRRPS